MQEDMDMHALVNYMLSHTKCLPPFWPIGTKSSCEKISASILFNTKVSVQHGSS